MPEPWARQNRTGNFTIHVPKSGLVHEGGKIAFDRERFRSWKGAGIIRNEGCAGCENDQTGQSGEDFHWD
jgi:hypothetical protein